MGTNKSGVLFVVATPIGNLEDISFRAVRILGSVDALACEDTRHTRIIFDRHTVPAPKTIFSYHEHNEEASGKRIIHLLDQGKTVALCTKAGCPGISDPGYRIISRCIELGHRVEVIPGASAVTTALLASGLPPSSYTFKGFPPRKPGARRRFLEEDRSMPHTLIFFESPQRLARFVDEALEVLGDRRAAICIELTKKFEETHRGYLSDLAERFRTTKIKGEVTVVVAGNHPKFAKGAD